MTDRSREIISLNELKVGQKFIDTQTYYDWEILEINGDKVKCKNDRFEYDFYIDTDVIRYHYRRYVVRGDHNYSVVNQSTNEKETAGSWTIWDNLDHMQLCIITSGASRMIAQDMCDALNYGVGLERMIEMTKKKNRYY